MARDEWRQKEIEKLLEAVAKTRTEAEVEELFDCILTTREINDMAKRLEIRTMLKEGKSYLEIRDVMRVSPNIVSRVSNQIGYGFRRTNERALRSLSNKPTPTRKYRKPPLKYKGAVPLHRVFG